MRVVFAAFEQRVDGHCHWADEGVASNHRTRINYHPALEMVVESVQLTVNGFKNYLNFSRNKDGAVKALY